MKDSSPTGKDGLELSQALRVDQVCDRFEEAWLSGRNPRIEDYLAEVPEGTRPALLREILGLELEFRTQREEMPAAGEYKERFAAYIELIDKVFDNVAKKVAQAGEGKSGPETLPEKLPSSGVDDTHASAAAGDERYPFLAPPQQPDEIGRLGPYRVLKALGGGGMGIVFQAEDPQLHRLVALKTLERINERPAADFWKEIDAKKGK